MRTAIIAFVLLFSGPAVADEIEDLISNMEDKERAFAEEATRTWVGMMSLETLFPDKRVRELARAASNGNLKKVDELVAEGVDVNSRGTRNGTPLYWAMRDLDGFEHLLELGADPNVVFDDSDSVMREAVNRRDERFLRLALAYGGDPNLRAGPRQETLLFDAVSPLAKDKVSILLEAGADMDAQSTRGETPMMLAATRGQFDVVYTLLERGADYTITEINSGYSLLDIIAQRRSRMDPDHELTRWMERVIRWLEDRGAEFPE